jgi:hypothetical protein
MYSLPLLEQSPFPTPQQNNDEKICYAFMGVDPVWNASNQERVYDANDPIASGIPNIR